MATLSSIKLLICSVILSSCAAINEPYQETRVLLGTYVTIKISDKDKTEIQQKQAVDKAFAEIKRVENLLSSFRQGNVVDKINSSGIQEVALDKESFYVLERAKYSYDISGGTFDITVLPLLELWGFHKKNYSLPNEAAIKETLDKVGSDKMVLNKERMSVRFSKEGMRIDLGGIGKGYAVDRAVYILRKEGVKNALVAAAGDIYCMGRKSENKKWTVGVRDPIHKNKTIEELELEDTAISTSGGYENFFEIKGKRYSHIIEPKTGRPAENDLASVTIIAKDNLTADALATAVFVLGKEKGLKLIKGLKDVKAIVITNQGMEIDIDGAIRPSAVIETRRIRLLDPEICDILRDIRKRMPEFEWPIREVLYDPYIETFRKIGCFAFTLESKRKGEEEAKIIITNPANRDQSGDNPGQH